MLSRLRENLGSNKTIPMEGPGNTGKKIKEKKEKEKSSIITAL